MALIRCPGCRARVSNRATECSNCGAPIAGAAESELAEARRLDRYKRRSRLRIELLASATVFVFGALWTIADNVGTLGGGSPELPPVVLTLVGGAWYLVTRARLWWSSNR